MKFTVKGIFLTLGIILLGFLFLIAPTYVMGMAKNYVIAYENKKEAQKEDHWIYDAKGRRFVYHDGSINREESQEIDGITYYFDSAGYVKTGWVQEMGQLYYRNPDGTPETGWFEDDSGKYYLDENGSPAIGWTDIEGKKYYFSSIILL